MVVPALPPADESSEEPAEWPRADPRVVTEPRPPVALAPNGLVDGSGSAAAGDECCGAAATGSATADGIGNA